ncbi:hypothetical protein [Roseivivax sediminis]|uniref:Uncharacterized protein n=1 Tax=Roseivivax sediminis TaxID=936889 RepID=A0A1I1U1I0_9RHOB|nr:hypothetical protein [Roseivivax sediminis]SFD64672.1 hypothetical protein SAMN04515678_10299 [Roseivivax sediminis]
MRALAGFALALFVAACGAPDPGAKPRKPDASEYFKEDAPASRRAKEKRAAILADEDGDGVVTTGYAGVGVGSDGVIGRGGFLMRRGNFTLGMEL